MTHQNRGNSTECSDRGEVAKWIYRLHCFSYCAKRWSDSMGSKFLYNFERECKCEGSLGCIIKDMTIVLQRSLIAEDANSELKNYLTIFFKFHFTLVCSFKVAYLFMSKMDDWVLLSTYEIYVLKIAVISLFPCFLRCFKNFSSEIFSVKLVCPVYFSITFLDLLGPWNVSI